MDVIVMAYVKILNLRLRNAIRQAADYIMNEKKTGGMNDKAGLKEFPHTTATVMMEGIAVGEENADIPGAIGNLVNYTSDAGKTERRRFVSGINCTVHHAAAEMKTLVEYWKERRRITGVSRDAFHIIQSFNPADNEKLDPERAHQIGRKFASELQHMDDKAEVNRRYMMLICTHVDRQHIHNHIVMCSYDIDTGRKFHECREVYRQMKESSDRLCREYGISVIAEPDLERRNTRNEWEEAKKGTSWKDELRKNIEAMCSVSRSWDEFVRNMEAVGYQLRQGKYVTYTDQEGHRVRDKSLGREWTKGAVENRMERQQSMVRKTSDAKEKIRRLYLEQDELYRREAERFSDTVSSFDENGRRRSDIEKILLAAMQMILEGEAYGIGDGYTITEDRNTGKEKKSQKRYQRIADVMEVAKTEGIGTEEDLRNRMDRAGKELSYVNLEIKKNQALLNKMGIISEALNEYDYDDGRVESHSAITPTRKMPEDLHGTEKIVYECVRNRFMAVFSAVPCIVERIVLTVTCGDEMFKIKGDVLIQEGWQRFEKTLKKDSDLPEFEKGEILFPEYTPAAKRTTPPKRYTVESLNNWMLVPAKTIDEDADHTEYSDEEWKDILSEATICTEATRADIIDRCIKSNYITLSDGNYSATDYGFYLIDVMRELGIDLTVSRTVGLSKDLHDISIGRKTESEVLESTKEMLVGIMKPDAHVKYSAIWDTGGEVIGNCPICGEPIRETHKAFSCTSSGCRFSLWKENRYFKAVGAKITKSRAKALLKNGRFLAKGLKSRKSEKVFDAYICMDGFDDKGNIKWRMEFPRNQQR